MKDETSGAELIEELLSAPGDPEYLRILHLLARELAAARAEIAGLRRDADARALDLSRLENELERLRVEKDQAVEQMQGQIDELRHPGGPPPDVLALPLVFLSESGEFLGVTDAASRHFSLRDFVTLLDRNTRLTRALSLNWLAGGLGRWRLNIRERVPGQRRERFHMVEVSRMVTPRRNTVAMLERLSFDGRSMPGFFIYELFKHIGRGFAE